MLKLAVILFLFGPSFQLDLPTCRPGDYHFEYTECDSNGGRWRVQVPKKPNSCTGGAPRPAVRGKSCDFTCDKGQYLDISGDQECKHCQSGTFSLGDGIRFENWEKIPEGFTSTAESFRFRHFEMGEGENEDTVNCSSNAFSAKGSYLSVTPGDCNAQLTYSVNLVKTGSVLFEFQYPEESEGSALFHFTIQNDQCESDLDHSHKNQWPTKTKSGAWGHIGTKLEKGLNVLKWRVVGIGSDRSKQTVAPVLIRKIEVTGVGFTSVCAQCKSGTYSSEGSEICTPCKPNTFSKPGADMCKPCNLATEYSYEGAGVCTKRPPCTKDDYYQIQLPCVNGKTQKSFEWIQPQICRKDVPESIQLPGKTDAEDCPPCNPGMFLSKTTGCQYCPDDQMSDGKTPCQKCPASTSPDFNLEMNWFNTMPNNMSSECILFSDDTCKYNSSWMPMGDHLVTHFGRSEDAYLLLMQTVSGFRTAESKDHRQIVGTISFEFSTQCSGRCEFVFLVEYDGHSEVKKEWSGPKPKTHFSFDVSNSGPMTFSWAFQRSYIGHLSNGHVAENDLARMYSIKITNSLDGGAVGCKKCPKGVVDNRKNPTARCVPCPAGHYIDVHSNSTTCQACPLNTIIRPTNAWGKDNCVECGQGLKASAAGDKCVTDCTFTDKEGKLYDFTKLNKITFVKGSNLFTGSGTKYYHGFNISLCGGDKMVTCTQNVSSPEKSTSESKFSESSLVKGVVCRSTIIPSTDASKSLSTQPTSLGDYIDKIVTNKSLVEMYKKEGYSTEGSEKDIHFYSKSEDSTDACPEGRNTIISLKCDQKMEDDGEIVFPPKCVYGTCDGCNFHLLWKTVYACPKCAKEDFVKIVAECVDGSQSIHYTKPDHCIGEPPAIETQKCAIKLPFIVKVVVPPVVALGLILLICVIYCWQRNKNLEYKYMKLTHQNEPTYDGELPGVDSCGLSDGEEDQFDSVQFKTSRGSKILNKIRGKRSDKDDENPFETGRGEKIPLT
ncbi:endosome/lysosome-associated apoptosis and autophagy regulator family member 2-like isoform X3 [Mytilus trossulus]|uniref:endosome/lysosome-associated apoptosis and autophagy regulator family member 2-like isoform X3 n=1 Tax=Mytilus trossulus TaxID=6551 RepID=UPI0030069A76